MTYLSSGCRRVMRCRRVIRFRVHVASLSDKSCASRFAASSVKRLFGRRQVVIVQVGSLVVSHDCGFVGSVVCLVARVSKKLRRCEVRLITTGRMTRRNRVSCWVMREASYCRCYCSLRRRALPPQWPQGAHKNVTIPSLLEARTGSCMWV